MILGEFDRWEHRLPEIASALEYPATPHLAARSGAPAPRRLAAPRAAWVYAAAIVALLAAGAVAIPQVRASVIDFLRFGAVRLIVGDATATPTAPATAVLLPSTSLPTLSGRTTLEEARARAGFPIRLPSHPSDLGPPDDVYFQQFEGQVVITVWRDASGRIRLALYHLTERDFAFKAVEVVEATVVSGNPALWVRGPHFVRLEDASIGEITLAAGNVLIWTEDGVTYRLEADLALEEAVRIAESLR